MQGVTQMPHQIIRLTLCVMAIALAVQAQEAQQESPHRVYMHLTDPAEHPDYARKHVKPPTYGTFGNHTQFVTLRAFSLEGNRLVQYAEDLESYTKTHDLGCVVWPHSSMIFAENVSDLADEIKRRNLFLFDLWGYVPGSGPGSWEQFIPPAATLETLETKLGDHWLGMDNGEQDGRYIGGYASQTYPISSDRLEQYYHFQRHFERMGNDLGNKLSTLVSLNFGHYFLKEGIYTSIGAETAQALPNSQVYYSFIRGRASNTACCGSATPPCGTAGDTRPTMAKVQVRTTALRMAPASIFSSDCCIVTSCTTAPSSDLNRPGSTRMA
jgi:hypothetical protein